MMDDGNYKRAKEVEDLGDLKCRYHPKKSILFSRLSTQTSWLSG